MIFQYRQCLVIFLCCLLWRESAQDNQDSLQSEDFDLPNSQNCQQSNKEEQMRECTGVLVSRMKLDDITQFKEEFSKEISNLVDSLKDNPEICEIKLNEFCQLGRTCQKCFKSLITVCPAVEKNVEEFMDEYPIETFVNRFCSEDGQLNSAMTELFRQSDWKTCAKTSDSERMYIQLKEIYKSFQNKLQLVDSDALHNRLLIDSNLSPSEKIKLQQSLAACRTILGAVNRFHQIVRQNSQHSCNEQGIGILTHHILMNYPSGLNKFCHLPAFSEVIDYQLDQNTPRDESSQVMILFGSTHIQLPERQGDYVTCDLTSSPGDSQLLFSFDTFEIVGSIQRYNNSNAAYLSDVRVKLLDKNVQEFGSIQLPNHIPGSEISKDDEVDSDIQDQNSKFKIVNPIGKHLRLDDPKSGISFTLRRFDVLNQTPFYSIVLKLPNFIIQRGSGLLFEGCIKNIDIDISSRRQKRAIAENCAEFDDSETRDSNAHTMQSLALSDEQSFSLTIKRTFSKSIASTLYQRNSFLSTCSLFLCFLWYRIIIQ